VLNLTRHRDEQIRIDTPAGPVFIRVNEIRGGKVRLGVDAPHEWDIKRLDAAGNVQAHKRGEHPEGYPEEQPADDAASSSLREVAA